MVSTCKLCLNERELQKSHIFPKFLRRLNVKDKEDWLIFKFDSNYYKESKTQDLPKENLLCSLCEQKFGIYENYMSKIFKTSDLTIENHFQYDKIYPIDTYKIKYFFLSILWRTTISSLNNNNFGKYREELRLILQYECKLNFDDYAVYLFNFNKNYSVNHNQFNLIDLYSFPVRKYISNCNLYTFYMAGLSVSIIMGTNKYVSDILPSIRDDNTLFIYEISKDIVVTSLKNELINKFKK